MGAFGTSNLIDDKVFFLSAEEVQSSAYGFTDNTKMIAKIGSSTGSADEWRLRSPHATYPTAAGIVAPSGGAYYDVVNYNYAARPAFNLNLNSVLFSSAAEGGKSSGTVGTAALNLVSSTTPTEWKLTLKDSSRSFTVTNTTAQTVAQSANASVSYTGATVGTNEYVSAMIVDASNNILYYGRIKAVAAAGDAGGTADIAIPASLAAGSYTLKVFSEQYNGDKKTDYASAFSNVALTVETPPVVSGVTPTGTGVSTSGNIAITFSEAMNTTGTVSLDGGSTSLTGGSWSVDKLTYTIPYSGPFIQHGMHRCHIRFQGCGGECNDSRQHAQLFDSSRTILRRKQRFRLGRIFRWRYHCHNRKQHSHSDPNRYSDHRLKWCGFGQRNRHADFRYDPRRPAKRRRIQTRRPHSPSMSIPEAAPQVFP